MRKFLGSAGPACVLAGALLAVPATSDAAIFTFSFQNVQGAVSGTVTGEITLPDGDGFHGASSVVVKIAPAALSYAVGFDFMSIGTLDNRFNVINGGLIWEAVSFVGLYNNETVLALAWEHFGGTTFLNMLNVDDLGQAGVLDSTSSTLVFQATTGVTDVPEPASLGLLALSALGLAAARRRRPSASGVPA